MKEIIIDVNIPVEDIIDGIMSFDHEEPLRQEVQKMRVDRLKAESFKTYRVNYMIGESYHYSTIKTDRYEDVTAMINRCFTGMSDCKVLGIEEVK